MVSDREQREQLVRAALGGVGDELLDLGPEKSGHILIHFQNGVPLKVEWRLLARPVRVVLTGGHPR